MKTLNLTFTTDHSNHLMAKVALCTILSLGSYYQFEKLESKYGRSTINLNNVYNNQFGQFDKVELSSDVSTIKKMITILRPSLPGEQIIILSEKISAALKGTSIPPQLVVAIIDTESLFDQNAVSSTGDLSLAQINPEIWNKEFLRRGMEPVDIDRLKNDHDYSLSKMIQILSLLKKKYEKKDRRWYARYHSQSRKYKMIYLGKLEQRMKLLEENHKKTLHQKKLIALQ